MLEIKNPVTDVKNTFGGTVSQLDIAEEKDLWATGYISRLSWNSKVNKDWKKKPQQNPEQNIEGLWDNYKRYGTWVMGLWEEKKARKEQETYLKQ